MPHKLIHLYFFLLSLCPAIVKAQKPVVEGYIIYKVSISNATNTVAEGTYTITYKGKQLREELKLDNGYQDVLILDNATQNIYSLKIGGDKKYAIQLSMDELVQKNKSYENFTLTNTDKENKNIAGMTAKNATITYSDGSTCDIWYTSSWQPMDKWMFEHFPGIKYLPLSFVYTQGADMQMRFVAQKIESAPVENAFFKVPADYKMISYAEYLQMGK